ncbi:MAG TPA: helix-turn-helix domain-containing protein [Verrucomicrobiae bacterium]|nr:helix-turn-helix domain-containing protein [Verrucomicrobiae bacterium]
MDTQLPSNLQALGLGDYEAKVLAVLLEHSPSSATVVAKRLGLSRSSVYTTLSSLIAKGLVGTTYKNDVKQFEALGYDSLEQFVKTEQERANGRVSLLNGLQVAIESLSKNDNLVPQAIFFEGQEGLKRTYLEMLRQAPEGAELRLIRDEFVWSPTWAFVFEDAWKQRVARLKQEKNLATKLLVNGSPLERGKAAYYAQRKNTQTKYLTQKNAVTAFAQYSLGDVVVILSLREGDLSGIKLTNRNLAANYTALFDALWDAAKK